MNSVLTCMVSDQLGPGVRLDEFTSELARRLDGASAIAVREYERAITLAFDSLGLGSGDKLLISPLAPAVYADVLRARGIEPVFCEVDQSTGMLDIDMAERMVGDASPKAILLDCPLGAADSLDRFVQLETPIVEDASHGLGAGENSPTIGTIGRYTILSLEPEAVFTTGGGAAVVARGRAERSALKKAVEVLRPTALLPDMNAALGLAQIRSLDSYIARRREVADLFRRSAMRGRHRSLAGSESSVPFAFPVLLDGAAKDVIGYARKKDVEVVWAFAESVMAIADSWDACTAEAFPNASALLLRCVLFPLYPTLTKGDVERISRVLSTLP